VKNLEILYLVGGTRAVSSADAGMGPKTTVQSLAPLAGLTSLKKLNLDGCDLVRDFSPVAGLVNLSSLGLEQCAGATNLSFLAGLKQLRSMGLPPGTTDDQLAAICKEHPDLLHLNAELCGRLTDLAPLAGLPLESLNLELSGGIKDIGPAATLKNLRAFGAPSRGGNEALAAVCKGAPGIRFLSLAWAAGNDIAPLAELKSLEWLYLGRFCAPKKLDLKVLSGIKSLTCINFDCGDPGEIGFVAPMTWLRHLCLRECRSLKEISPLAGLANLEVLSLRYCWSVKDIAPLSGLSKLRWFDHCLCPAEDLAPLSNLPELVYMDLGTCVATNAAPLRDAKNLKKLKYLTFGYSKMSKAERRAVQEALPDCRVN
jgi:internalin A